MVSSLTLQRSSAPRSVWPQSLSFAVFRSALLSGKAYARPAGAGGGTSHQRTPTVPTVFKLSRRADELMASWPPSLSAKTVVSWGRAPPVTHHVSAELPGVASGTSISFAVAATVRPRFPGSSLIKQKAGGRPGGGRARICSKGAASVTSKERLAPLSFCCRSSEKSPQGQTFLEPTLPPWEGPARLCEGA